MIVPPGAVQVSVDVFFADDTGAAVTGKLAADFPACKWSSGTNTADTAIVLSDLSLITTAHPNDNVAGGIKEREGGWYRLDLPNNMISAAGRKTLTFAESSGKRIIAPFLDVQLAMTNVIQINGAAQTAGDVVDKALQLLGYSQRATIRGTVGLLSSASAIITSALEVAGSTTTQFNGRVLLFDKTTATAQLQGQGSPIVSITVGATPTITLDDALSAAPSSGDVFTIY